jgi:hypothetical protein
MTPPSLGADDQGMALQDTINAAVSGAGPDVVRGCRFGTSTPNKTVYRFRYDTPQPMPPS